MALRALKTDDELAAVPLSEPVLVELPGVVEDDVGDTDTGKTTPESDGDNDGSKQLQEQLEALKAQNAASDARAAEEARKRQEAERLAAEREDENKRLRARGEQDESALINNGLAAAQAERDSAKAAFTSAFEAGDPKAMADAQEKIGRAAAKILQYESGAAELAERVETRKTERTAEPDRRAAPVQDFASQVNTNPNLLPAEREWMIANQARFNDPKFNRLLDAAYVTATEKEGLVRGTPAYFDHIETFTGIKQPARKEDGTDMSNVQAPVTRNERGSDGRPTGGKIMLSPEQREIARSMGVTDTEYARQVANFDTARRADPDRYK